MSRANDARKAAIAAAMKNPVPAIRNEIRPIAETVRVAPIPVPVVAPSHPVPSDEDRTCVVRVIRSGSYDPGRMGDCTTWNELEVEFFGDVIKCFHADISGMNSDDTWLAMECEDEGSKGMEWYEDDGEIEVYDFRYITPIRDDKYRHVKDILDELKREGTVSLR